MNNVDGGTGGLFRPRNKPQRRGRAKPIRGAEDDIAAALIEEDFWDDLQEWCSENPDDREIYREYFNKLIPGCSVELGDLIFEDGAERQQFKQHFDFLTNIDKKTYIDELVKQEVIVKE